MTTTQTLETLWASVGSGNQRFLSEQLEAYREPVRRYLLHAIEPGTALATAVRLKMHGEIKIKKWLPFSAEQVIVADRGMIWQARTKMMGLPVTGFDRIIGTQAEQRWRIAGLIPVVNESGPDIARSTAGRMAIEYCWLPSALCRSSVQWNTSGDTLITPALSIADYEHAPAFTINIDGSVQDVRMMRWGNPDDKGFREAMFGGIVLHERTFGGYTIPCELRIGWRYNSDTFEEEHEFFRCTITEAVFK